MVKTYTDEWNGFQFRSSSYMDGHEDPYNFDLIKWKNCESYEALQSNTKRLNIISRYCFTIGSLIWDPKEEDFEFHSCGMRYLENHIDGLEQFILDFSNKIKPSLLNDTREEVYV